MTSLKRYRIENKETIFAKTPTGFVTKLRRGSYFDHNTTNAVFKLKFSERYKTITGKQINCDINDDEAFVNELIKHGFIKSVEDYSPKIKKPFLN